MSKHPWRGYRSLPWYWKVAVEITDYPIFIGSRIRKWVRQRQGWSG